MIKYIPLHQATCDKCGQKIIQVNVTQVQFLIFIRSLKWTAGNNVLCPFCQDIKKSVKKETPAEEQMELNLGEE